MSFRVRSCAPLLLVLLLAPALRAVPQGGVDKSLFLTVLDENGRPVRQFTADDVMIREDGQDRAVVAVRPASEPISVAILVDTAQGTRVQDAYGTTEDYVRDLRVSIGAFAKQLLQLSPDASVMLMEFGQAAIPIVKFTSDPVEFDKGVNKIISRAGVGSVLGEALQ